MPEETLFEEILPEETPSKETQKKKNARKNDIVLELTVKVASTEDEEDETGEDNEIKVGRDEGGNVTTPETAS